MSLSEIQVQNIHASLSKNDRKKLSFLNKLTTQGKPLNLKIGKYDVDKGQIGFEYSWDEAINGKLISTATRNRVEKTFNKLGINPEKVYLGWKVYNKPFTVVITQDNERKTIQLHKNNVNLKSTYVLGHYKGEPIIAAQRQANSPAAGQFYIYSPHVKSGKAARLGNDNVNKYIDRDDGDSYYSGYKGNISVYPQPNIGSSKDDVLNYLKINKENSLSEAMEYKDIFSPETLQTLKGKSGESLRQMMGNKTLIQGMMRSQELLDQIAEAESGYTDLLENEAIEIVKKAFPIIDYADIEIDAKIGGQAQVSDHEPEESEDGGEVEPDKAPDDKKRRVINAITQGSSVRGAFAYLAFRDSLDHLDDQLVDNYSEILKLTFGTYDDEQAIAMMLAMLAQGKKIAGGESNVKYDEEEDKFVIHATAINFPFLVHEIVKGLYEILALQGFSTDKEKNKGIIKRVDKVEAEPRDLQYGKFIYDGINNLYVNSSYDDSRVRDFLYTEIYKLEGNEFMSFIENAINNKFTPQQKGWAEGVMKQIDRDLKKDDTHLSDLD